MAKKKYGKYIKKLTFKDEGPGFFRQITKVNGESLGVNARVAVDYLLKPVNEERLGKTIGRLRKLMTGSPQEGPELSERLAQITAAIEAKAPTEYLHWLKVQHDDGIRLIPVKDVFYFKAGDKYTIVMSKDLPEILTVNRTYAHLFRQEKTIISQHAPHQLTPICMKQGELPGLASIPGLSRDISLH